MMNASLGQATGDMVVGHAAVRVLLVDDNPDHRELMRRKLADSGFSVRAAQSAEEALDALEGIDLVLLDYRMPGMSGLEALGLIRERNGPSVVMVTGMGSEDVAVQAMRAGAIDYIAKGATYLAELPQVLERAWRHHDLSRRAAEVQRLALLVTSASDRDAVCAEVVEGARRLLRADGCSLFILGENGVEQVAVSGEKVSEWLPIPEEASKLLAAHNGEVEVIQPTSRLLVPLPSTEGMPLGVLALVTREPRLYLPEEARLVKTFASFAGLALGNVRRLEIERAMVAELSEMLDLRRQVVASVSHELRTPLTCVRGFAETLLAHWDEVDDDARRDFVSKIKHHAVDLGDLIDRLADFAAIEAGRLKTDFAPLDLDAAVRAAVEVLAPVLADRPLHVETGAVTVLADAALLRRTLANLLTNAAKFSPAGSPITVRSLVVGKSARVEVVDQGIGLTPEEAARVFEPFWRSGRSYASAIRGSGLGLSLVKEYLRVMGGKAGVESAPGKGSTFYFVLPIYSPKS